MALREDWPPASAHRAAMRSKDIARLMAICGLSRVQAALEGDHRRRPPGRPRQAGRGRDVRRGYRALRVEIPRRAGRAGHQGPRRPHPRLPHLRARPAPDARLNVSRAQDFLDYLDGPMGGSFTLAPEEAMAFYAAKGRRTTFDYRDMLGTEHTAAFTVAKMMDTDLLADVHASLLDAMATGTPFRQWADGIVPLLQAKGWWGRKAMTDPLTGKTIIAQLGSPGRLQTIFRTNMQTAYAAGAWAQIEEQAELAPFLLYDAVDDHRTRPEHAAWDGQVHPVGSPFWRDHYPPNGWN